MPESNGYFVNTAISDAVIQSDVAVLATASNQSIGALYQTVGNTVAMAVANAVEAQNNSFQVCQSANIRGIGRLLNS